jgi:hypothetical protein
MSTDRGVAKVIHIAINPNRPIAAPAMTQPPEKRGPEALILIAVILAMMFIIFP